MSDIIIDANVIRNIGQGNRAAAEALQRLLNSGRKVYIARAAIDEVLAISERRVDHGASSWASSQG